MMAWDDAVAAAIAAGGSTHGEPMFSDLAEASIARRLRHAPAQPLPPMSTPSDVAALRTFKTSSRGNSIAPDVTLINPEKIVLTGKVRFAVCVSLYSGLELDLAGHQPAVCLSLLCRAACADCDGRRSRCGRDKRASGGGA